MEKLEIGGNSLLLRWGNYLTKVGKKYIRKGSKLVITNPTCKLHSPWLLIINFTVNNKDKYTLTLQGDYKEKYKTISNNIKDEDINVEDVQNPITIDEMFILIRGKREEWFLKD
jgi:hypothetical protein